MGLGVGCLAASVGARPVDAAPRGRRRQRAAYGLHAVIVESRLRAHTVDVEVQRAPLPQPRPTHREAEPRATPRLVRRASACGATVRGTYGRPEAGTRTTYVQYCLWHVQHAGGWHASPVRTCTEASGRTCQHRPAQSALVQSEISSSELCSTRAQFPPSKLEQTSRPKLVLAATRGGIRGHDAVRPQSALAARRASARKRNQMVLGCWLVWLSPPQVARDTIDRPAGGCANSKA